MCIFFYCMSICLWAKPRKLEQSHFSKHMLQFIYETEYQGIRYSLLCLESVQREYFERWNVKRKKIVSRLDIWLLSNTFPLSFAFDTYVADGSLNKNKKCMFAFSFPLFYPLWIAKKLPKMLGGGAKYYQTCFAPLYCDALIGV